MRASAGPVADQPSRLRTPPGVGTPLQALGEKPRLGAAGREGGRAPRSTPPAKSGRSHLKLGEGKTSLKSLLQFLGR